MGMGLIGGALKGAGDAGLQLTNKAADYVEKSTLQDEASQIQALRDQRLEEFAAAREQRGYSHAETMQGQGFAHAENLQDARQTFETEQNEKNRGVTREQMASHEKISAANNAVALKIANIGGTVQPDKDGNILWIGKDGKAKQIMDPNDPEQPLKSHKDLTPAAKAYSDVLKAQLVDLDRAEIQAAGDPQQMASIKQRRAEYTGTLLNVLTGGIGGAAKPGAAPQPTAQDVSLLKGNPSAKALFDQKFGAGAADKALSGGAAAGAAPEAAMPRGLVEEPPGTVNTPPEGLIARKRRELAERAAKDEERKKEYGDASY